MIVMLHHVNLLEDEGDGDGRTSPSSFLYFDNIRARPSLQITTDKIRCRRDSPHVLYGYYDMLYRLIIWTYKLIRSYSEILRRVFAFLDEPDKRRYKTVYITRKNLNVF